MNTKTILNLKTDKSLKIAAQKTAEDMGMPLGTVVNAFLRQFVREKELNLSLSYRPSKMLRESIAAAEEELASGKPVKTFATVGALFADLNRP